VTLNLAAEQTEQGHRFATTRWSLLLSSVGTADDAAESHEALGQLCRLYWRPIFAYIYRRGLSLVDAQDLTQEFFMRLLNGKLLQRAVQGRSRFRALLLRALQNFLNDTHDKRSARKRGGGMEFVSWDDWMAEAPSHLTVPARAIESWSAERLFDVRWAATIVEQALRALREECEICGRGRLFDALQGALAIDRDETCYSQLLTDVGLPEAELKRLVQQLRLRYRALLRREVARTVETEADVDDEIRYLCKVLASSPAES
jgi:RNA polymerase sigma-70 factor (ECF subfamily)